MFNNGSLEPCYDLHFRRTTQAYNKQTKSNAAYDAFQQGYEKVTNPIIKVKCWWGTDSKIIINQLKENNLNFLVNMMEIYNEVL
jgi:hypothetical protein